MKNVHSIHRQGEGHWVGDGFPVHTVFHYQERPELSPFILLDHAGPADFAPSANPRGVGWHPHRGFETVSVVYDGEVDHHDTAGNGGETASETELVILDRKGDEVTLQASTDATVFVMNGQPIDEPVYGYGPFVMNKPQEIEQAYRDFRAGKLGTIPTEIEEEA